MKIFEKFADDWICSRVSPINSQGAFRQFQNIPFSSNSEVHALDWYKRNNSPQIVEIP